MEKQRSVLVWKLSLDAPFAFWETGGLSGLYEGKELNALKLACEFSENHDERVHTFETFRSCKNRTLPLEMIHQDSNKFSNSVLVGRLFAEEADDEVLVVLRVEHHKLVLSIGDTQARQLRRDGYGKPLGWFSKEHI